MKIIKKLCIPLLSLVLVLSCFTVSQMDASAAMSANDRIGPGSNQGGVAYPDTAFHVFCQARNENTEGYYILCACSVYQDATPIYPDVGRPYGTSGYCGNCRHSFFYHTGGGGGNSHTHSYSTTWGAWRKISSCRLPG